MSVERELEERVRLGRLYDFYGGLLTERQKRCLEEHFLNDLSLGEIAEADGVSRQAISDLLKRVELILENYETKLGLLARDEHERERLSKAELLLKEYIDGHGKSKTLLSVRQILQDLVNEGR